MAFKVGDYVKCSCKMVGCRDYGKILIIHEDLKQAKILNEFGEKIVWLTGMVPMNDILIKSYFGL